MDNIQKATIQSVISHFAKQRDESYAELVRLIGTTSIDGNSLEKRIIKQIKKLAKSETHIQYMQKVAFSIETDEVYKKQETETLNENDQNNNS